MELETASQVNPTTVTVCYVIIEPSLNKCVDTCMTSPPCVRSNEQYHFEFLNNKLPSPELFRDLLVMLHVSELTWLLS